MAEPADLPQALAELFKDTASVAGLVAGRVFGGELPPGEAAHMPRKALVVALSGGISLTAGSFAEHDTQRIDLFAYGATPLQAAQVLGHASLAMRRIRSTVSEGVLIHWAKPAGGQISGRDDRLEWPRAFQSFQVFHALEALT